MYARHAVLALGLLAGATVAPPGSAVAADWRPPFSYAPAPASAATLALDGPGDVFAGWSGSASAPTVGVRTSAGALAPPAALDGGPATAPVVAANADGVSVAAWIADDGPGGAAEVRFARGGTGGFGARAAIADTGDGADDLAVAIDGAGVVLLAWTILDAGGAAQVRTAVAVPGVAPVVRDVSTGSEFVTPPSVAMSAEGAALVTWTDSSERVTGATTTITSRLLVALRRPGAAVPDGVLLGPPAIATITEINQAGDLNTSGEELGAAVSALDEARGALVAVQRLTNDPGSLTDGDDDTQTGRIEAATGSTVNGFGVPSTISPLGQDTGEPVLVGNAAGHALAAWSASGDTQIAAALRAPGGPFAPAQLLVVAPSGRFVGTPTGAVRPDGTVVVAWTDADGSGTGPITAGLIAPGAPFTPRAISATPGSRPRADADGIGNAVVAWASDGPAVTAAAYDGAPPTVASVAVPARATPGAALEVSLVATDAWSPFSVRWRFGDGTTADGARVSHTYDVAGTYEVTAELRDEAGNTVLTAPRAVTISADGTDGPADNAPPPPPAPPPTPALAPVGPPTPAADTTRPRITRMSITRTIFATGPARTPFTSLRAAGLARGSELAFRISEPARVEITVSRLATQRGAVSRCLRLGAPARRNIATIGRVGRLSLDVPTARASVPFSGRIGTRPLRRGRYAIRLRPVDRSGNVGAVKELRVTVC